MGVSEEAEMTDSWTNDTRGALEGHSLVEPNPRAAEGAVPPHGAFLRVP